MKLTTQKTILASAVLAAAYAPLVSHAQLEEVVVTAEFREANLQDTPISMQAFTAQDIADKGISNPQDLFNTAAGVVGYEAPTARGTLSLNVRGAGSGNPTLWQDPAIALYVDGVYIGKGLANGVDSVDLERIEILRGPQGTLYGRNSTGGAVNFITRKPGEELGGTFAVSAGNYGYQAVKGRLDLPLSDTFSMALSFQDRQRDEFFDNSNPEASGFQDLDRQGYRLALSWTPTDTFSADYSYARQEIDEHSQMLKVDGFIPTGGALASSEGFPNNVTFDSDSRWQSVAGTAGFVRQFLPAPIQQVPQVQQYLAWADGYVGWANNAKTTFGSSDGDGASDQDNTSVSDVDTHTLTLTWDVSDRLQIKSITGYRDSKQRTSNDIDGMDNRAQGGIVHDSVLNLIGGGFLSGLPFPLSPQDQFGFSVSVVNAINSYGSTPLYELSSNQQYDQFSQEIQFIGEISPSLRYVGGLYYYEDSSKNRNRRAFLFPLAFSDTTSFDLDSEAMALFGELTWDVGNLSITGGLRYTDEKKDVTYLHRAMPGTFPRLFGHLATGGSVYNFDYSASYVSEDFPEENIPEKAGIYGQQHSEDFDNLSGRLTAMYRVSDSVNVYGTYSTGYRSGGFNGESYSLDAGPNVYDEETMTNYEIGIKADFWDGTARLNAAAFLYEYDDMLVNAVAEQNGALVSGVYNAGSAERDGVELEFTWQPVANFSANLTYMYLSGTFDEYPANIAPDGTAQETTPFATRGMSPDDQVTYNLNWRILDTAAGSLNWNLNGMWQGETYAIPAETDVIGGVPVIMDTRENQDRHLVNTRLSWDYEMDGGKLLSIAAWGMNITDEDYRVFGYGLRGDIGLNTQIFGAPRTYGVELSFTF